MRILLGFFALFPVGKKVPSAELPREVSSWTPAAYVAPSGSDEWVLEEHDPLLEPTLQRDLLDPT